MEEEGERWSEWKGKGETQAEKKESVDRKETKKYIKEGRKLKSNCMKMENSKTERLDAVNYQK